MAVSKVVRWCDGIRWQDGRVVRWSRWQGGEMGRWEDGKTVRDTGSYLTTLPPTYHLKGRWEDGKGHRVAADVTWRGRTVCKFGAHRFRLSVTCFASPALALIFT